MYNLLKIHYHALNIDKASDSDGQMQHTTSLPSPLLDVISLTGAFSFYGSRAGM
jgi:hypothetical protein